MAADDLSDIEIDRGALLQIFLSEFGEEIVGFEESLLRLESEPDDSEAVATLFRLAHTVKGNAATVGLVAVAELAHAMEDILDEMRAEKRRATPSLISLLLRAVDALRTLVPRAVAGQEDLEPAERDVLEALRAEGHSGAQQLSPGGAAAEPVSEAKPAAARRTLRVNLGNLDAMINLVGQLVVARGRLAQTLLDSRVSDEVQDAFHDTERLSGELQRLVLETRMVPLGPVFRQFARTIRDLAVAHGKQARLVVEGGEVEVDTGVIEKVRDPLTHMVRNAMDHGIESPEARRAAGKDPVATIALRARHEGGRVVIELSDDGDGLKRRLILAQARERGLVAEGTALSDHEVQELIFRPGFSTAEHVTQVSGRGVGMDVVRRNVTALRGRVEVASREGAGTTFTLRLPLTLAVIQGLLVSAGGETYVVPLDGVLECLDLPGDATGAGHASGVLDLRGDPVPYVRLRAALGSGGKGERESVVIVTGGAGLAGLAVDAVLGEGQVVIKPLDRSLHALQGLAGCTVLGDGRVALILDVPALIAEALAGAAA